MRTRVKGLPVEPNLVLNGYHSYVIEATGRVQEQVLTWNSNCKGAQFLLYC